MDAASSPCLFFISELRTQNHQPISPSQCLSTDICAVLDTFPVDGRHPPVCPVNCFLNRIPQGGNPEDATAGGDDIAAGHGSSGMEDKQFLHARRVVQAGNLIPFPVIPRISTAAMTTQTAA